MVSEAKSLDRRTCTGSAYNPFMEIHGQWFRNSGSGFRAITRGAMLAISACNS